jgi:hypothetical protein
MGRDTGPTEQAPEAALMQFLLEDTAQTVLGAAQNWRLERVHAG